MSLQKSEIVFDENLEKDKVSVIMPAYNCENFIDETIQSLLTQTYTNWELIAVDDCSTDKTAEIIKRYGESDSRIKYIRNEKNLGAALTRNKAVSIAKGQYLAFLDSDDIWKKEKLEKQLSFMKQNCIAFSCTAYGKIDEHGNDLNRVIPAEKKSNYWGVLKNCPGNSTVMYDAIALGKHIIPDIRKRNDYVMWLSVIKNANTIMGMDDVLGFHRVRTDSISSKKTALVKYHWFVYRQVENLSFAKSSYLIFYWIGKGLINKLQNQNK